MIPKELTNSHFEQAIQEIDQNGIPKSRESYRYFLIFNGKKYPPKYVISIANKYLNGKEWPPDNFNAVEAKNYFIRNKYKIIVQHQKDIKVNVIDEDEESSFPEGKEKYEIHRKLERDTNISKKAKKNRLSEPGDLRCDVCGFSFLKTYGELGAGYIEAHHTIPISKMSGQRKTKLSEIALVCSNCHHMLHKSKTWLSIGQLKNIIEENKISNNSNQRT